MNLRSSEYQSDALPTWPYSYISDGGKGFEPLLKHSKCFVLPLHYTPIWSARSRTLCFGIPTDQKLQFLLQPCINLQCFILLAIISVDLNHILGLLHLFLDYVNLASKLDNLLAIKSEALNFQHHHVEVFT